MRPIHREPTTPVRAPNVPTNAEGTVLAVSLGDADGQLVAIAHRAAGDGGPSLSRLDLASGRFDGGGLDGDSLDDLLADASELRLPLWLGADGSVQCDDPIAIAAALLPGPEDGARQLHGDLVQAVLRLGHIEVQAAYEAAHGVLYEKLRGLDDALKKRRFLSGSEWGLTDAILFTFAVRLDPVYYELFKASVGVLSDFPHVQDHARDLFELPPFHGTTDFEAIRRQHHLSEPVLNPKGIVPRGGLADLDGPHFRDERFADGPDVAAGTEEQQDAQRGRGEWVRNVSRQRNWIDPSGPYPPQAGRYHLYAPYNCPWSHRALLGRAVKGLQEAIGASVLYFRRDPDRGWQFNPHIPGCTADLAHGKRYLAELYEMAGADERSAPVLWDTQTCTVVSNESADILRMLNSAFGDLAQCDLDLRPAAYVEEIDRLNGLVYQRINNGAYKAGFAKSQAAYERAFERYFRALDWIEDRLATAEWLARSDRPTEADLRLFPTVFRHDAVYYARFKLNRKRIGDLPCLADWLDRMMQVPGVAQASNLDHARNGYFGRTGNGIVPAGPVSLQLSPKDFPEDVWLNQRTP